MSVLALEQLQSPPLAPGEEAIDLDHLARMTLGERSLEREVLGLFDRQTQILLQKMAAPATAAAAAHTLKGSALGVGAWRVARAAEAVEFAGATNFAAAVESLRAAADEARDAIAALLRTH